MRVKTGTWHAKMRKCKQRRVEDKKTLANLKPTKHNLKEQYNFQIIFKVEVVLSVFIKIVFCFTKTMFSYTRPKVCQKEKVTMDGKGNLKFDPPVHEQRCSIVLEILEDPRWSSQIKSVVEFGCGDMQLLRSMRFIKTLQHIIEVDIDEDILIDNKYRAEPFTSDFLKQRNSPFRIEILKGNILHSVDRVRNIDAVIAIELLSHLEQNVLEKVPSNIFGFMQPKLAIFSTPNREYNVLFKKINSNGFRIADHKFEWTREQFRSWAENICNKYTNYSVAFIGIGSPPINRKEIGHVTQVAIFARNDTIDMPLKTAIRTDLLADQRPEVQYKEIYAVDYPYHIDTRTIEQKIKDESTGYINRSQDSEKYHIRERCIYCIPIKHLHEYAQSIGGKEQDVLNVLKSLDFHVEDDFIILSEEFVDENYRTPCSDLVENLDDEDFLSYDFQCDEAFGHKDMPSQQSTTSYVDSDDAEPSWD